MDAIIVFEEFASAIIDGLIQLMNSVHPKIQRTSSLYGEQTVALTLKGLLDDGVRVLASRTTEEETLVKTIESVLEEDVRWLLGHDQGSRCTEAHQTARANLFTVLIVDVRVEAALVDSFRNFRVAVVEGLLHIAKIESKESSVLNISASSVQTVREGKRGISCHCVRWTNASGGSLKDTDFRAVCAHASNGVTECIDDQVNIGRATVELHIVLDRCSAAGVRSVHQRSDCIHKGMCCARNAIRRTLRG
mmetsp:Transcript_5208/g.12390  ORF Transcript_5208/g.12390 Transcript_5208/m.12390 type:complete len:249 (+) Transcript_5208:1594-2340(+)